MIRLLHKGLSRGGRIGWRRVAHIASPHGRRGELLKERRVQGAITCSRLVWWLLQETVAIITSVHLGCGLLEKVG